MTIHTYAQLARYGLASRQRTLTERVAKRIRRGQPWGHKSIPDVTIEEWAKQYAKETAWK